MRYPRWWNEAFAAWFRTILGRCFWSPLKRTGGMQGANFLESVMAKFRECAPPSARRSQRAGQGGLRCARANRRSRSSSGVVVLCRVLGHEQRVIQAAGREQAPSEVAEEAEPLRLIVPRTGEPYPREPAEGARKPHTFRRRRRGPPRRRRRSPYRCGTRAHERPSLGRRRG